MVKPTARILVVMVLLLLIAVGAGAAWWRGDVHHGTGDPELVLYGNVDIRQVELAFNGNERIAAMEVQEGDRVKKGELLARMDTRRLKSAADQARARVAAQRQVVARLLAGSRPEEVSKARADVAAAQAEAYNAVRNAQRQQALVRKKLISSAQADDAAAAADAARARLDAARQTLKLVLAGPRREDIAAAQATLQADQAALALAQVALADADLYAPADGVVQDRILEPGDMASPARPAFTLALTDPMWVRAYVAEPDLGKIRLGMRAEITTDSYPAKRYPGWIGFISPTAEFTPKSVETPQVRTRLVYQVRVYVCNPQGELRLGMPTTVHIPLRQTGTPQPDTARRCAGR
ncbi:MAG: hemolysin D [Chromatiales bacterium 21-64-14]|nr:MAG: hemolysin D [Chromatiales bacterium 21-64-14]HQU15817.1 efflux RND transporter periplasmic adaptor subunit [Gammaproteobacteria bacterium]